LLTTEIITSVSEYFSIPEYPYGN